MKEAIEKAIATGEAVEVLGLTDSQLELFPGRIRHLARRMKVTHLAIRTLKAKRSIVFTATVGGGDGHKG